MITSHALHKAFSTLGCPAFTLEQTLALAARHQFDAVELRALAGELDLPMYFMRTYGSPAALAQTMRGHPVRIAALNTSFKLVGPTAGTRENLLQHVPWAEALGIRWLRVFDGGSPDDAGTLDEAAATLRWWQDLRHKRGWSVDIMVETHDSLVSRAMLKGFIERAPSAALLWDTHHTWRKGGEPPPGLWPLIRSHVVHIHVKDSVADANGTPPYRYVLPGTGEFPMADLRAALQADHFEGLVSLESERLWIPELPELEQVLASAMAHGWW